MKFLFINPGRVIGRKNIWSVVNSVSPPLGIATLAALLEREGFQADIIDAAALRLSARDVVSRVGPHTDVVGLTATTPEIESAVETARALRRAFPRVRILMGGVHPTVFHRELVTGGACDMVIRGEAEAAVLALARRQPEDTIPNLTWRSENGDAVANPQSETFADLNALPFPAYHKLPMKRYRSALGAARRSPSIGMITSRGCPGKCTFCYSGMFGAKIRFMTAEKIIEHITSLRSAYGIREISFYDDTFTASRTRIERLCNLLISERMGLSWSCFARVDAVTPDLLRLMKEAGCHQVCYGFESADEAVLKAINKRIDIAKQTNAIRWTTDAGIDIRGAFMLGSPGETGESMMKTLEYSKKIGIQFAMYNITTPYPGTALFAWATENGSLEHTNWGLYDLAHPILKLPTAPSDMVQRYYFKAYREFYLRPSYIWKRLRAVRTMDDAALYLRAFLGIFSLVGKGRPER